MYLSNRQKAVQWWWHQASIEFSKSVSSFSESVSSLYLQYKCILINLLNRHQLTKSLPNTITNTDYNICKLSLNKDIERISNLTGKDSSFICSQPILVKNLIKNSEKTDSISNASKISKLTYLLSNFNRHNKYIISQETYIFANNS